MTKGILTKVLYLPVVLKKDFIWSLLPWLQAKVNSSINASLEGKLQERVCVLGRGVVSEGVKIKTRGLGQCA